MRAPSGLRAATAALLFTAGLVVNVGQAPTASATALDATGAVFQFGVTGQTVENVADLDRAVQPPAAITYRGVATINSVALDAVVTFAEGANLIGQNAPANHVRRIDNVLGSGASSPYIESQVRTTTNSEAWARIRVDFYLSGTYSTPGTGTPVTLTNLSAHFYDVDSEQSVEVNGATTYTLADNTHLTTTSASGTGAIKFTSANVDTSGASGTSYTVGRVTATYASTSTIEYRLFVPPSTDASFNVDISPGLAWTDNSVTRTQIVTLAPSSLLPAVQTVTGLRNCPISMTPPLAANFGGTVSYVSTSGIAPPGLTFSTSTGVFAGTPTADSSATVGITATGSVSGSATANLTFAITNTAMTLAPATQTVNGTPGTVIAATSALTATNPCSTVTYAVTSGTLPAGLSLNATTGAITGTPTEASTATVTITATDTVDNTRTAAAAVTFNIGTPSSPAPSLPPAVSELVTQPVAPATPPTTAPPTSTPSTTAPPTTTPTTTTPPAPVPAPNGVLPDLDSTQTLVTENGDPVAVELVVENDSDLVLRSQDFELRLRGNCTTGCTITEDTTGRETIHLDRNGAARVSGFGFLPGSLVHVWIFSEPRYLGALLVAADGTYDGSFPLNDIEVGGHTLQTNGISFDNVPRSANLGIIVIDNTAPTPGPTTLPATGTNTNGTLWAAILIAAGFTLITGTRRRRTIID